jgi:hypothetical protein
MFEAIDNVCVFLAAQSFRNRTGATWSTLLEIARRADYQIQIETISNNQKRRIGILASKYGLTANDDLLVAGTGDEHFVISTYCYYKKGPIFGQYINNLVRKLGIETDPFDGQYFVMNSFQYAMESTTGEIDGTRGTVWGDYYAPNGWPVIGINVIDPATKEDVIIHEIIHHLEDEDIEGTVRLSHKPTEELLAEIKKNKSISTDISIYEMDSELKREYLGVCSVFEQFDKEIKSFPFLKEKPLYSGKSPVNFAAKKV